MKPLRFHGYSDDTFGEFGRTNVDHDNCANGKPIIFMIHDGSERMLVFGQYAPRGTPGATWVVGAAQVGEEEPWPNWAVRIVRPGPKDCPYSAVLEVDAPADAVVTCLGVKDEE